MSNMKMVALIANTDHKQRQDFGQVIQALLGAVTTQGEMIRQLRADVDKLNPWKKVVFAADCDEDGNCPICNIDFADCSCPGPTMEDHDYVTIDGELYARRK